MAEKNKSGYSLNGHPCAQEEIDKKEGMPISPFKYAGCTYKKNSGQSTDWQNTAHDAITAVDAIEVARFAIMRHPVGAAVTLAVGQLAHAVVDETQPQPQPQHNTTQHNINLH
jgi:hypothetical protein